MEMAWLKAIWILCFVMPEISSFSARLNNACPGECVCFRNVDSWEANCSGKALHEAPSISNMGVEILDLSSNLLTSFPRHLGGQGLTHLSLAYNQISQLGPQDLLNFEKLVSLDLSYNNFSGWLSLSGNEAFLGAASLKYLYLNGNQLTHLTDDDPESFLHSLSLKELSLEDCGIQRVQTQAIDSALPNLEALSLSRNNLKNEVHLQMKKLKQLHLSNCNMKRIKRELFVHLPSLEMLNVSRNLGLQIDNSAEDVLSESLLELDMSYCSLDDLHISGFPNLEDLSFRNNMLRSLRRRHFQDSPKLLRLDISNNHIQGIEPHCFLATESLNYLDLSFNSLGHLNEQTFASNLVLYHLNLSHNEFQTPPTIESDSLETLDLSFCRIQKLNDRFFSPWKSIEQLHLQGNELRTLPITLDSMTMVTLDLSFNRIDLLDNMTFLGLPKLTTLKMNDNSLTTPSFSSWLATLQFLRNVWLGNNPYDCQCSDHFDSVLFLKEKPKIFRDASEILCAQPAELQGQSFESVCSNGPGALGRSTKEANIWGILMGCCLFVAIIIFLCGYVQKCLKGRRERQNERELARNNAEMDEIRRMNARMLRENSNTSNAPSAYDLSNLPSYEDALRMPKLQRPAKSMLDLTATERHRKSKLKRTDTEIEMDVHISDLEEELMVDKKTRFHSVEMLSNRDKERTAYMTPNRRRDIFVANMSASNRQISTQESRFASSFLKSQNLQSAEKIGNFQSYENSPYTKRRPKIPVIPPFKRATLQSNSVEFLTDPEFEPHSKSNSPFARRKPKLQTSPRDLPNMPLNAAKEDHFGSARLQKTSSSEGSDFQIVVQPELSQSAAQKQNYESSSSGDERTETPLVSKQEKRKKRRNSSHQRTSGNKANETSSSISSSTENLMVVIPKPSRETKL